MSHYEMAQKYAQHGYVCLPVSVYLDDDGKKNAEFPTEYKSASFDNPEDWEGFTGLAINTALSGIVVVDIDKGPDKDGWAGLHDAGIELPDTPMKATTQSGGEHWYYRRNSSVPVAQSSGLLADDVDIRGDASGIVYVFPTEVGNGGGQYTWQGLAVPVNELPEFPTELAQRLAAEKPKRALPLPPATPPELVTPAQRERLMRIVGYKLDDLRNSPPGSRFEAAKVVMRIIGIGKALGEVDEFADLIRAAFPGDPEQIEGCIDRALRNADPEVLPEDDVRGFWDQRPELAQIRQAAFAGLASPWAVLGAVCVRVLADVPPTHRVMTGMGDPAGGNLNLYAVLAAESGGGKGIATQVARHLWPSEVYSAEIGSGEALPKLFARKVKDPESGEFYTERIRDSVVIDAPEFGSLSASGARSGATLMQRLCNGFSGEGLSFAVSDEAKNVDVGPNTYRLGVVTGVQYGNAGLLLSPEAMMTGLPQRFVWFPANVKPDELPHVRPEMPGPLHQWTFPAGGSRIEVCDAAKRDIEAAQRAKLIGDTASPLDGHKLYTRVKLAYALAVLNGHYSSVREEDWELSGIVMAVSDATRKRAVDTLRKQSRKQAETAGTLEGLRKAAAAEAASDEAVNRTADSLERWLQSQHGGTRSDLRKRLRSDKRDYFDDAVELLIEQGRLIDRGNDWFVTP